MPPNSGGLLGPEAGYPASAPDLDPMETSNHMKFHRQTLALAAAWTDAYQLWA